MLNLLRMDLYRIFRSKSFYICLGILLIDLGFTASGNAADTSAALKDASLLEVFGQGIISNGSYAVLLGILSSLFICVDFESGFIKNIMTAHENKWDYVLSKTISTCIINFLFLAITFLASLLLNVISGGLFRYSSAPDVMFFLFSAWMLVNGFLALNLLIGVLTRNKAAGIAVTVCINSGMIVALLTNVLGLFGLDRMTNYTISMNLVSLPSSFSGEYNLKPFLTGLIYFIVYTIISKIVLSKRDI